MRNRLTYWIGLQPQLTKVGEEVVDRLLNGAASRRQLHTELYRLRLAAGLMR